MGRLFQYNRLGATTEKTNKWRKDTQMKSNNKPKSLHNSNDCPAYSNIYKEIYNDESKPNLQFAFQKCQQWDTKLPQGPVEGHSRSHSVYDSMKDFLRRKLFSQPTVQALKRSGVDEVEPTSDYDENDLLESSYNADVEEDDGDCSCASSNAESTPRRTKSPQKSLLSLNCWQSSQHSDTSSDSSSSSSSGAESAPDDSDAGISDCCQLLTPSNDRYSTTKRRQGTPKKILRQSHRYNINSDDEDEDEESELLDYAWYQPRMSAKTAVDHLLGATPGSFLLRRSTPRSFELCLRLEHKVKQYPVQTTRGDMYRLKGAKKQFSTLKALITHHSVMAEQLPLTLDLPREQHVVKSAAIRYADDFEPLESLQLLGILKSLQAKNFEI